MGDLSGHGIILTKWNPAPEPSEDFATEGKGTPNHARNRTCHAAAVAVATISTLALGFCGSMTSEFINQSRLLEEVGHGSVAPAWDCSLPCGVQCVHSSVCNVSASGNVFYCSTSVGGRCFAT